MRRLFVTAAALVALTVAALPGVAGAQAPAPKVTITGLIDQVSTWSRNLSIVDGSLDRSRDKEWYARTRVRPDIVAEVGKTKMVLGLEIDATWGQTGVQDTNVCLGGACPAAGTNPQRFGENGGWDLNTDTVGLVEVKWAYTEFDVPLVPWQTRLRLGAQPFATTYKAATLATGDFAGAHLTTAITPMLGFNFTYGQLEEQVTGARDGFVRGDDYTIVTSFDITPMKGLDLRPIYSYLSVDGTIAAVARQGRGGVSIAAGTFAMGNREARHTIGLDARWQRGPFSFEPTIFYQFGGRELGTGLARAEQDISAWFVDLRGGWQLGPLRVEGAFIYTPGNSAREDIRNASTTVNFYQPTNLDASFYAGWAEIVGINVDYNSALFYGSGGYPPGINMGNSIGYDKYGLVRLGSRVSYALTPALSLRGAMTASWTDEAVDTRGTYAFATGITPSAAPRGRETYLGTEVDLGLTYRFAPGIAFDLVGAYLFAGDAFARGDAPNPSDVQMVASRMRFAF